MLTIFGDYEQSDFIHACMERRQLRMIAANWTLVEFSNNIGWIINLFVFHLIMNFIYMKSNSIYGSIIPHWISDLAYEIVSK